MDYRTIVWSITTILLALFIFIYVRVDIKSLKMTANEARKMWLFFSISFVPIYAFLISLLYLLLALRPTDALMMSAVALTVLVFAGIGLYLPHVVDPRLKREYGTTLEYIRKRGIWDSLKKFEEYKK
ncbi:hypothetical protein Thermo_01003 [Thermoplasmatales archaeon]|nr:hypothetical protein Thermo_01003 [Thermoplasmatales archaeon]